ncbi:superoxide dismutase, Fe-Mn family [Natronorubrum sediminis]|uniref:superoxide dismutase n=1 Tax=Natronorubrum sediminis TaxID=640943 RepID=A0A1H6FQD4_9EURY|nr:superoxide dismutase [Natronorubrum sediminis]SEH13096.1 superoxide dismutase, Fe-Mn family [Natronorubrum sediminis]
MPNDDDAAFPTDRRAFLESVGLTAGVAALASTALPTAANDEPDANDDPLPMSYDLPDLPYEYDALEPHIDREIMELHHSGHHQAYVDGANDALEELEEMREADDFEGIKAVKRDLAFNLSGHVNHAIFWENMAPDGGGEPTGTLADAIDRSFGSFEAFRNEFTQTAADVESVGWAMLFYEPLADELIIGQVESQHLLAHQDSTPLLTLDVWEHAYYLQYQNERDAYIDEWWNVVDWDDVAERYEAACAQRGQSDEDDQGQQDERSPSSSLPNSV